MLSPSRPSMKPERFVEYMENCYNDKYHNDMRKTLIQYLGSYNELYIYCLARVVLLRYPRQYRTAPGIAELEKYSEEAEQEFKSISQDLTIPELSNESDTISPEEREKLKEMWAKMKAKLFLV